MCSNCMWALRSWLWASCSKKPWYIKIKMFRKQLMESPSCFPADCSSGSLAACSQGWLGSPEARAAMDENLWLGIPQSATSRDHGLGTLGDVFPNLTWNRTSCMDWRRTLFFSIFKMIPRAGPWRALCTDKVRPKCLMHTENRADFGLSLLQSQIFSYGENTTALLYPKTGFCSVMPTPAWRLKVDFPILSLEIWCHNLDNSSLQCCLFYVMFYVLSSLDDIQSGDLHLWTVFLGIDRDFRQKKWKNKYWFWK